MSLVGIGLVVPYDYALDRELVVSCTNLSAYDVIADLEAELGLPVLTANQVSVWGALRRLGHRAVGSGQRHLEVCGRCPIPT